MTELTSTAVNPWKFLADIFQSKLVGFRTYLQKGTINIVAGRVRRNDDPLPTMYFAPVRIDVEHTGIGSQKTVFNKSKMFIMYYTDDFKEDLFIVSQIITQIVVENNKAQRSKQVKKDSKHMFTKLNNYEFNFVLDTDGELMLQAVVADLDIADQVSHN